MKPAPSPSRLPPDPGTSPLEIRDLGIPLHPHRPPRRRRSLGVSLLLGAAVLGAWLSGWPGLQ